MTIHEIIQRVESLYSKGVQSRNSRLTKRHIYNKLISVRAKLIAEESKKKQKTNQWNYQTLSCVELIETDIHECPCLPPLGCKILRTKYKLPKPLTNYSYHLIQSVTSLDGNISYQETTWSKKKYQSGNKYAKYTPDYFIRNGYLYITYSKGPKIVTITGLFSDPVAASSYPNYCMENSTSETNDCQNYLDADFPIDNEMIDTLISITIDELVILFSKNIEDLTNNSYDNIVEQSK